MSSPGYATQPHKVVRAVALLCFMFSLTACSSFKPIALSDESTIENVTMNTEVTIPQKVTYYDLRLSIKNNPVARQYLDDFFVQPSVLRSTWEQAARAVSEGLISQL